MSGQHDKDITQYISHFGEEHCKIAALSSGLHQKLLTVTMLSALAEGRFATVDSDRKKFIKLVEAYSTWPHAKSVSIRHLHDRVQLRGVSNLKISTSLVTEVERLFAQNQNGLNPSMTLDLSTDPEMGSFPLTTLSDGELRFITDAKHSSLLYLYRCKLVHEFREPGHGWDFGQADHQPIYRHQELVYPAQWMISLVPPILVALKQHYLKEQINPYDSFTFGTPWL